MKKTDLVRIHHADYQDDIPFWISWTEGNQPVLEVGCGHGRVALPLLVEGREVVGVDFDLDAIQSLRADLSGKESELQARAKIIHTDIFEFPPQGLFGAVIIPCNTFSTFTAEERQQLIDRVFQHLKPEGVFAASMPNPVLVRSLYEEIKISGDQAEPDIETSFPHPGTGFPVQVSSTLAIRDKSLGWDWIYDHLHPDGQVDRFVRSTEHYLSTLETYLHELSGAGFDEILTMGDFDSSEYSTDSPYLILIARKPGS